MDIFCLTLNNYLRALVYFKVITLIWLYIDGLFSSHEYQNN